MRSEKRQRQQQAGQNNKENAKKLEPLQLNPAQMPA